MKKSGENEKVSGLNLFFLLVTLRLAAVLVFMPVLTAGEAMEDAWAAALLAMLLTVPVGLILVWASRRSGDEGLPKATYQRFGKLSLLLLVPLAVLFISLAGFLAGLSGIIFGTVALTETPAGVLSALMLGVGAYAASKGLAAISRAAQIVFILVMVSFVFTIVGVSPILDSARLLPRFARGPGPIFKATIIPVAVSTVYLAVILPASGTIQGGTKALRRATIWSIVVSYLTLCVYAAASVMAFTALEAQQLLSPAYTLAQSINIRNTLERLEVLILTIWMGVLGVDIGAAIYSACQLLATGLGLKSHTPLVLPLSVISAFLATELFMSVERVREFIPLVYPIAALAAVALIVVSAILSYRKREVAPAD